MSQGWGIYHRKLVHVPYMGRLWSANAKRDVRGCVGGPRVADDDLGSVGGKGPTRVKTTPDASSNQGTRRNSAAAKRRRVLMARLA